MEHALEQKEHPPRNLRTHFDETVAAMTELETPEWLRMQDQDPQKGAGTVANARHWLSNRRKHSHRFIVMGFGGINRWVVYPDGTVTFLFAEESKAGTQESADRAASLGFVVERKLAHHRNAKRLTE